MDTRIKIDLEAALRSAAGVHIELGCGQNKTPGRIGVDIVDVQGVDIVADLNHGLPFLPDSSVDTIHTTHFLEHVGQLDVIIGEMCRVLKKGGRAHNYVPHFSNPHFYSDYTHCTFFGLYTLDYFCAEDGLMRRHVCKHYTKTCLRIVSRRLIFASVFNPVHYARKVFQLVVNASPSLQEFYEDSLCWLIPCHGVEIVFMPDK